MPILKTAQKVTTATPVAAGGAAAKMLHDAAHDPWTVLAVVGGLVPIAGIGWVAFHPWPRRAPTPGLVPVPVISGAAHEQSPPLAFVAVADFRRTAAKGDRLAIR